MLGRRDHRRIFPVEIHIQDRDDAYLLLLLLSYYYSILSQLSRLLRRSLSHGSPPTLNSKSMPRPVQAQTLERFASCSAPALLPPRPVASYQFFYTLLVVASLSLDSHAHSLPIHTPLPLLSVPLRPCTCSDSSSSSRTPSAPTNTHCHWPILVLPLRRLHATRTSHLVLGRAPCPPPPP